MLTHVDAGVLRVAYEENGPTSGPPVVLLHGFPYDVHAYAAVTPQLVSGGCRVLVPYLRGYGPTQFRSPDTPRSGQQGVLAQDLLAFLDALAIECAVLAGYDWGGRAACIVAALWPARVQGLVTGGGYNVQDIPAAAPPAAPDQEWRFWYQYYFQSERGRAGLAQYRDEFCRLLWQLWSPTWHFDEATYAHTAVAFTNPDFVPVVIHSYRHRFGLAPGDPAVEDLERRLLSQPPIAVPTITLHGEDDGVTPVVGSVGHDRHFTGRYQRRVLAGVGHNIPQETPDKFAQAVLSLV
jgi:pimeloyl-ACP methyl ester carboxylesterase